jgi:Flp pilus assembly pilin Flp
MMRERRRGVDEDGAALVEFALVFVLFMMLVWGVIAFGSFWATQQAITHAAAEGARAMVGSLDAENEARAVVARQFDAIGQQPEVDITPPEPCGPANCRTVTVRWIGEPLVPPLFGVPEGLTHPSSSATVQVD